MRLVIKIGLVLVLGVAVVTLLGEGPGYVLVQVGPWVLETTAALGAMVVVALLVLGWGAWGLLSATRRIPARIAEGRAWRSQRRSLELLQNGLLALERGEAHKAQRLLTQGAELAEVPAAFYLGAARAAYQAGSPDQAQAYLDRLQAGWEADDPGGTLLRAEIERDSGRRERALALLADLEHGPHENARVLERLLQLYRELEDHEAVLRILPKARKAGVVASDEADELARSARGSALEAARQDGDGERLERLWKDASRRERNDPRLVGPRFRYLLDQGQSEEARRLLEQALGRNWRGPLVELFLALPEAPGSARELLERLEGWREDHPKDPHLLTVLAQLAISAQYWGKADQYLAEVAELEDLSPELLLRIGHLYRQRGRTDEALACCRRSLAALDQSGGTTVPALQGPTLG